MFLKTGIFAFVMVIALTFQAQSQTLTTSKKPTKTTKVSAASGRRSTATTKGADTISIVRLNHATQSANLSLSSQVMHPVSGRTIVQAAPKSMSLTSETKYKSQKGVESTTQTDALGLNFARGLSNDLALTISTDIGKDKIKDKGAKETVNSGFSDFKVAITKMNDLGSYQQSFLTGRLSGGLEATLGFAEDNQSADGNRFSGGYTLGAEYVKQTVGVSATTGYKIAADIKFARKQDIKTSTPVYSAIETTGGHILTGEFFAEKTLKQTAKIGGAAGLQVFMPMNMAVRQDPFRASTETGQLNIMSFRAFAAFDAGQLEFLPSAIFQRNIGTTTGDLSVESYENVGLELTTRFSL
jgi:hypothetical protein